MTSFNWFKMGGMKEKVICDSEIFPYRGYPGTKQSSSNHRQKRQSGGRPLKKAHRNIPLFINRKGVVDRCSVKSFRVGNGVPALLEDVDAVAVGLVGYEFAFHKIGHVRVYLVAPDLVGDDGVAYRTGVFLNHSRRNRWSKTSGLIYP